MVSGQKLTFKWLLLRVLANKRDLTPFNALVTRLIHAKEDIVRTKLAKEKENFEI